MTILEKLGVTESDTVEEIARKAYAYAQENYSPMSTEAVLDQCLKDFTECLAYRRIAIYEVSEVFVAVVGFGASDALTRQQERWEA